MVLLKVYQRGMLLPGRGHDMRVLVRHPRKLVLELCHSHELVGGNLHGHHHRPCRRRLYGGHWSWRRLHPAGNLGLDGPV